MADLKCVYPAVDVPSAHDAIDEFASIWDKKYPKISKSWYEFLQELRKLTYTTNAIEGINSKLRKVTKTKSLFPTDERLFKMLYLAQNTFMKICR